MKRTIPALLMAWGLLSGCLDTGMVGRSDTSPLAYQQVAPRSVAVSGTALRMAGPAGYCIDPAFVSQNDDASFFLLGSCASIANARAAGSPRTYAMLTASVAKEQAGQSATFAETLAAFLPSAQGRASLSRAGDAETVTVLDTMRAGEVVLIRAHDEAQSESSGLPKDYWRVFFSLNGHVVALSVYALPGKPLSSRRAQSLALEFVTAMRNANATVAANTTDA